MTRNGDAMSKHFRGDDQPRIHRKWDDGKRDNFCAPPGPGYKPMDRTIAEPVKPKRNRHMGRLLRECSLRGFYVKEAGPEAFTITRRYGEHGSAALLTRVDFDTALEFLRVQPIRA